MSAAKHTPGPWEAILPGDERGQPQSMYSGLVALISTDPAIGIKRVSVVTDGRVTWEPEWESNARLIAAAPEMLAALEAYQEWRRLLGINDSASLHDAAKQLRKARDLEVAAIAKVRGDK